VRKERERETQSWWERERKGEEERNTQSCEERERERREREEHTELGGE
jgi:hypothetical protein